MQCNLNEHINIIDPIQKMLNEASAQVKRNRADIRDTLKLTNLKMSSLIRNTPFTSLEIEALELETQGLFSRLNILLSEHKSDIDRFPASFVIDLMVTAGRDRQMAEEWANRNVGTIEKVYKIWEE